MPVVLQGALAALLASAGLDEIVQLHGQPDHSHAGRYDVAIVTGALPESVRTDVLIMLPDTGSGAGTASVTTGHGTHQVHVESHGQVLDLLDEFFPSAVPRPRWAFSASDHLIGPDGGHPITVETTAG